MEMLFQSGGVQLRTDLHTGYILEYEKDFSGNGYLKEQEPSYDESSAESPVNSAFYKGESGSDITLNSGGCLLVSGGTVSNVVINSWGECIAYSIHANPSILASVMINSGGVLTLGQNVRVSDLTVNSGARFRFLVIADSSYIQGTSEGVAFEMKNGYLSGYCVNSGCEVDVWSNASVDDITVKAGRLLIEQGGSANRTTVFDDGQLAVGGFADSTTVSSGGWISIVEEAVASNITILSGGSMSMLGGTAENTIVSNGSVYIHSGTVKEMSMNSGYFSVLEGTSCTGITLSDLANFNLEIGKETYFQGSLDGNAFEVKDGKTSGIQLNSGCCIDVLSGCSAISTTLHSGSINLSNGGFAAGTVVNAGGDINIFSGAFLTGTIVNTSGNLQVNSGGSIESTILNSGASITFFRGIANHTTINAGTMDIWSGGSAVDTVINSGGYMRVSASAFADSITVNPGGELNVYQSATAVKENGGYVSAQWLNTAISFVSNTISGLTVQNDSMSVHSNTIADSTSVEDYGRIVVFDGGIARNTIVNDNGQVHISSGGAVSNTTINSGGTMWISSGGIANHTIVNDGVLTLYGGEASNTVVSSGGFLSILNSGVLRGTLHIESGGSFSGGSKTIIDFTVSGRTGNDGYLINNLSAVGNSVNYTLTVSGEQASGTYKLAQGVTSFNKTVTVYADHTEIGTLTVGGTLSNNGTVYTMNLNGGNLTLTVTGGSSPVPSGNTQIMTGNFNGAVFELTGDGSAVLHTSSGKTTVNGTIDTTEWDLVGTGDFNKDGNDGLLWIEKSTGYVYMQNDLTNFDEVTNKTNCLGVVGEGYEIRGVGDFTGTGIDGVVMKGPAFGDASISLNYGLPIWGREADGTTFNGWLGALVNTWQPGESLEGDINDLADINAKNYMYEIVDVGDYNGDGVDDVMLQNIMPKTVDGVTITGSGDVFTFLTGDMDAVKAGASPTVVYAGCATDGWEVIGSGDFNGDGIDDTLLSDGTGVAGWAMSNGQRYANQWFGNLSANEEIAGIADYNNDGTDDILIYNTATDQMTAWLVKDGSASGTLAIA